MLAMNLDSLYSRVTVRGRAREALLTPQTFAQWAKQQIAKSTVSSAWPARQWFEAFLLDVTGTPWIVDATTLDLALIPRHNALTSMKRDEHTTDDPALPLQAWVITLTDKNVSGTAMLQFIDAVLHDAHVPEKPHFLLRGN